MTKRDDAATVEDQTGYDTPDLGDLDALPALLGEGWVRAREERKRGRPIIHLSNSEEEDRGVSLGFYPGFDGTLRELSTGNAHHIQSTGETGNSGHGDTYVAGDFYLDFRRDNRRWNGIGWEGGHCEIRVRRRPDAPERTTILLDETAVETVDVDDDGMVQLDEELAGESVRLAVLRDQPR